MELIVKVWGVEDRDNYKIKERRLAPVPRNPNLLVFLPEGVPVVIGFFPVASSPWSKSYSSGS